MSEDVQAVLENEASYSESAFPKDSFQRILWDQQKAVSKSNGPTGRGWHPLVIRWAMSIRMQSSSAYRSLRTSGFLPLPSERTLNDYIHFYDKAAGFHSDLNDALSAEARVDELTRVQKYVALSFDEMKVKEDLVYDKNSCKVIGFVNLGRVNDDLRRISSDMFYLPPTESIATHILVFMIRGIVTSLRFPYAHFLTKEITANISSALCGKRSGRLNVWN